MEWHEIHSFLDGWGMKGVIPDNTEVLEEHNDPGAIPWKVVRHKVPEPYIWPRDAKRLLGVEDIFSMPHDELTRLHEKLEPLLADEAAKRVPVVFDFQRITLPKIRNFHPMPLGLATVQPLRKPLCESKQ